MTHPYTLTLGGRTVPLTLRRNRRARRMTLRYQPHRDAVVLTLPWRASVKAGLAFVEEKRGWLEGQVAGAAVEALRDGAVISLRGEQVTIVATGAGRGVVRLEDGRLLVPGAAEHLSRRVRDWLVRQAQADITVLARRHARRLDVTVTRITLRDTTSRWGSCTADGHLSFSWRLVLAPPEILDYVVCHEVAHLKEMNHSPEFWAWVGKLCPDYNRHRAWLKRHGKGLHVV